MGKIQTNEEQNQKGYQREKDKFLLKSVPIKKQYMESHTLILSPNPKPLKVDPEKLHEFFSKTAERLGGKGKADNATL